MTSIETRYSLGKTGFSGGPDEHEDRCAASSCAEPVISVIVPAYNTEKYIAGCLHSLTRQTLKDIEIIVIDDGSTDSTLSIIEKFASQDDRIKLLTQENKRQGAARNRGLEIASGKYIGFVDSDDWVDLDYYEQLYNTAVKHDADIAVIGIIKHKRFFKQHNVKYSKEVSAGNLKQKIELCEDKKHRFFNIYNKIYKTSLIKENNISFSNGIVCEDIMFSMKTLYYSDKVVSVPGACYHYRYNLCSAINSKDIDDRKRIDHIKAWSELSRFAKEHNFKLRDRLNYCESIWYFLIKIYKGVYKTKYTLLGVIPLWVKNNDR